VFDLTTSAVWWGPPVGIVRVESELARWALDQPDHIEFAFFDKLTRTFRHMRPVAARRLISDDTVFPVGSKQPGKRKLDRVPAPLRSLVMWLLQSRRMALLASERLRLESTTPGWAANIDRFQRAIMSEKYRALMIKPDGSRRACYPIDLVLDGSINFSSRDILVCTGAGWAHNDIDAIVDLKCKIGFKFIMFCHDVIPALFPQYFKGDDALTHIRYLCLAFPAADLVIFSSRSTERDARTFCQARGIQLDATAIFSLGVNTVAVLNSPALPAGLAPERYALLVGTIEPRKGHRMICNVWRKLLADGVPQKACFNLVFAGRKGWLVDDLMRTLEMDSALAQTVKVIMDADDATVAQLYQNAAFCLCPSVYEGYGLPIVEALSHGRAVLASTGGAVPELVRDFSPCLDPADAEAWRSMLRKWIEEPSERETYETKIRTSFRHPTWAESAETFFSLVRNTA
jgi:glycosyltransferase involved in cell wall biosynthesis